MITLNSSASTVYLSALRDHPLMEIPFGWCFSFSGVDTSRTVNVFAQDTSTSPRTFQRFDLNVDLRPYGMWYYALWPTTGGTVNDAVLSGAPLSFGLAVSRE